MKPINGALTPLNPLTFQLNKLTEKNVNLIDVLHQHGQNQWVKVPHSE